MATAAATDDIVQRLIDSALWSTKKEFCLPSGQIWLRERRSYDSCYERAKLVREAKKV